MLDITLDIDDITLAAKFSVAQNHTTFFFCCINGCIGQPSSLRVVVYLFVH